MTARISLNLGRTGVIDRPCSQSIFFRWAKLQRAEVLSENPGIFLIVEALVLRLLYEENFRVCHSHSFRRNSSVAFRVHSGTYLQGFKFWRCLFSQQKGALSATPPLTWKEYPFPLPLGEGGATAPGEGRKSRQILRPSPCPLPEGDLSICQFIHTFCEEGNALGVKSCPKNK